MNKLIGTVLLSFFSQSVFAIDLDFYVYGDFDATVGAFTRAALIFADGDYLGLFFITCVFGIFSGGVSMFWTGLWGQLDAGRILNYIFYPIMGITLYVTLIINTGTMNIFDETQNKFQAVGGVPDGLVLVAGTFNKFERIITEVASDNPATVRSALGSGTGIKLFLDAFASNPLIGEPELQKSLTNVINDCYDISAVSNVTLDLEYLRSLAPNGRAVLLEIDNASVSTVVFDENGLPTVMTCDLASAAVVGRLDLVAFDERSQTLCTNAGYDIDTPAEILACNEQLENVSQVFLGVAFGGTTRELFTNIAVYNTFATGVNNANIVVNGLGSREISSEGIATLAVTEDWLPQIRGAMLVTILSMFVLISLFLVTPLFAKALKVMMALFFFLAFWGASSSLLLMSAYDQVIYASRTISFHSGGLEAYLMAPTTAIQSLAIIGDSLSTAMMFAAALTTIFTGVSAYGFSNALAHAAGKVEGIGENQGRNLTQEGKAGIVERNANAYATNTVSGAMGPDQYGSAHVQSGIEKNYSTAGRAQGIREQGGIPSLISTAEGLKQGGGMVPTSQLDDPAKYGSDSSKVDIGGKLNQIQRATSAGDGNTQDGAENLEGVRSASTSSTLNAHHGDNESVDKSALTDSQIRKGHNTAVARVANNGGLDVEALGDRDGVTYAANHMMSKGVYKTDEQVIQTTHARGAHSAGQLNQNINDAEEQAPHLNANQAMYNFGKVGQELSNNPTIASTSFERDDLIVGEQGSMAERVASSKMLGAIAGKFFNSEGGPVDVNDKIEAAIAESPLRSMAILGEDMIKALNENGAHHLAENINPDMMGELQAATTINPETGELEMANVSYQQGNATVFSDKSSARIGSEIIKGDTLEIQDKISGNSLVNAAMDYENNPQVFAAAMDIYNNMSDADQIEAAGEINSKLPISVSGELGTTDSYTFNKGFEGHTGVGTPQIIDVIAGLDAGARFVTNSFQDNVDTLNSGATVKKGGIEIFDKMNEINDSSINTGDVAVDKTSLNIGATEEEDAKTERAAAYISTIFQSTLTEGRAANKADDVNDVNDYDSGKSGNILKDIGKEETEFYRDKGWTTGTSELEPSPQIKASQAKQLAEQEALKKKINTYNFN